MTADVLDVEWEEVAEGGTEPPPAPQVLRVKTRRVRYEPRERQQRRPGEVACHWVLVQADTIDEALAICGRASETPVRHAHDPVTGTGCFAVWSGVGPPDHSAAFPWERAYGACDACAGTGWEHRACGRCRGTGHR